MLNNSVYFSGNTNTNIKVNAVSGGIVKNHKDSFFLHFHLNSKLSDRLLCDRPHRSFDEYHRNPKDFVEVLQMVIVGDTEVIAEVIDLPKDEPGKDTSK